MNWDKPLTNAQFWTDLNADAVCTYHGFASWEDLRRAVRKTKGRDLYLDYKEYCKLMSSPLGQALS